MWQWNIFVKWWRWSRKKMTAIMSQSKSPKIGWRRRSAYKEFSKTHISNSLFYSRWGWRGVETVNETPVWHQDVQLKSAAINDALGGIFGGKFLGYFVSYRVLYFVLYLKIPFIKYSAKDYLQPKKDHKACKKAVTCRKRDVWSVTRKGWTGERSSVELEGSISPVDSFLFQSAASSSRRHLFHLTVHSDMMHIIIIIINILLLIIIVPKNNRQRLLTGATLTSEATWKPSLLPITSFIGVTDKTALYKAA